jgi:hypothetical protein
MAHPKFYVTRDGDFFQVIRATAKTVTVRPVNHTSEIDEIHAAFDFDVTNHAVADDFTTIFYFDAKQNADGKRCAVKSDGTICLDSYYGIRAYPSNGTATSNRNYR